MADTAGRDNVATRDLLRALAALLPPDAIVSDPDSLRAWECDGLPLYCECPRAVVMPRDADEIASVVRLCHDLDVPVVARGSGTGLSAGAMPHPEGIVLSLAALDRILDIDVRNLTARVQPGVTNLSISEAVAPYGLFYAPDPSSQIACSSVAMSPRMRGACTASSTG